VIAAARGAARPGDEVFFVDGGSSDGSAGLARAEGVEVVAAPEGKGRAVAAALERWNGTGWLCLLDGDITAGAEHAAAQLREAVEGSEDRKSVV